MCIRDRVEAVRHARTVLGEIRRLQLMPDEELMSYAKNIGAPYALVQETKEPVSYTHLTLPTSDLV